LVDRHSDPYHHHSLAADRPRLGAVRRPQSNKGLTPWPNLSSSLIDTDENAGYRFSWGLAFLGGIAATAVTSFLLCLGAGFGLLLVNPVSQGGPSAPAFLTLGAIYFFVAQAFGFAVGGHLAGRLLGPLLESRVQEDFRAATHGFAAWAVTVCAALLMVMVVGLTAATSGTATTSLYGNIVSKSSSALPIGYWVDKLYRSSGLSADTSGDIRARAEASSLLEAGIAHGEQWSADDQARLIVLTVDMAGVSHAVAEDRVISVESDIRSATNVARKVASYSSLWIALSLLFGAGVAMTAAVFARIEDDREAEE